MIRSNCSFVEEKRIEETIPLRSQLFLSSMDYCRSIPAVVFVGVVVVVVVIVVVVVVVVVDVIEVVLLLVLFCC